MPSEAVSRDLKALQELIQAQPTLKKPLIWLELRHIEREKLLCESVHDMVRVELVAGVRTVLSTAVSLTVLVLIYTKLVSLAGWLDQAKTVTIPLPPPINRSAVLDLTNYIPSSTALDVLADLPTVTWDMAWKWVAVIVAIVAAERLISGYQTWRRSQALRSTTTDLDEEASVLRGWLEAR
jgi:hypothetical protein